MRKYVNGMVDPRQGKFDSGDGLIIFSRNQGNKMQPDQYGTVPCQVDTLNNEN